MAILPWRFTNMGVSEQAYSKVTGDCCQHMGQQVLVVLGTVVTLHILINTLYMVLPRFQQLIASWFHFGTLPQMSKLLINSSEDVAQGKNPEILDREKRDGNAPGLDAEEVDGPRCVPAGEPAPRTPPQVCCCRYLRAAAGPVSWGLRGVEASPPFCLSIHSCSLTPDSQACSEGAPSPEDSGSGPRKARSGLHSHEAWVYAKDQRPGQASEHARPRQAQGSREASFSSPHLHHRHRFYRRACPVTSPAPTSSSSSCSVAYGPRELNERQRTGHVVYDARTARSRLGRGDAGFRAPSPYIYADVD